MKTSGSQPDIPALLQAARRPGGGALDRLLGHYRNYLRLLACSWLGGSLRGKADPSDFVQETLMEAHQGFAGFAGTTEEELAAWLRRILARNITDFVRRYRAAARDVRREEPLEYPRVVDRLAGLGGAIQASPSHSAQRRELGVLLADALAELSSDHREVIVLRNLQDLPWADVARRMGRSEEAVRKLWTRALIQLKPLVEQLL